MEQKDFIIKNISVETIICHYCLGDGELKVMQSMATYNGTSIRGKDTIVKCRYCDGTGLIK